MQFTKMQGLGNDYLYHYGALEDPAALSIRLSDRHLGIGADGLILVEPSAVADFKMRIFNADGSEAKMCGNGIRCFGKFVFDKGYTDRTELNIETGSGILHVQLLVCAGVVSGASVRMSRYEVSPRQTLTLKSGSIEYIPVSVGNPHAVIFVPDAEAVALTVLGPEIEKHERFPGGVNVEFVQVIDRRTLRMRVWERGSGVTMACGTGSCASVAAAVQLGLCPENEEIAVRLDGGTLQIKALPDHTLQMCGPAETVCEVSV